MLRGKFSSTAVRRINRQRRVNSLLHIVVLSRIGSLVLKPLEQGVNQEGQEGTCKGANPVDPVVVYKTDNDSRTERPRRVDRSAGPIGSRDVRNEDRDTDANGRKERRAMLLDGEEVDRQDELRGQEHLDEEALGYSGTAAQSVGDAERAGEDSVYHGSGSDASEQLGGYDAETSKWLNCSDENETEGDLLRC